MSWHFYRLRQRLPDKCLKSIYFAFVYPHLLHGIEVYANTRSTHLSKLITLNNKILQILQNKPYRSPVQDLYIAYNILPIHQLHIQRLLLLVHKCIYHKSMLPQIFLDYFHEKQTIYSHHKRQKTIFICIVFTQLLVTGFLNSMVPHYGMSSLNCSKISSLLKSWRNC